MKNIEKKENKILEVIKKIASYVGALYMLSLFLSIYVRATSLIVAPAALVLGESPLMKARLVPWADFVFAPVRILISVLPGISIALLSMAAFGFLIKKSKLFNEKEFWFFIGLGIFLLSAGF